MTRDDWVTWFHTLDPGREQDDVVGDLGEQVDILNDITKLLLGEDAAGVTHTPIRRLLDMRFEKRSFNE